LRKVFGLSLATAKVVTIIAENLASSLDDFQCNLAEPLQKFLAQKEEMGL
jgi:hypothetical protein